MMTEEILLEAEEKMKKAISIMEERFLNILTRIRLAANGAERNSMVLLEMINSTAITYNIPFISTEEKTSATLRQAQETVRNRIANYKQRSDWRKKGK